MNWGPTASAGTKKNREKEISLASEYLLCWREYSEFGVPNETNFRYLAVPVIAS
jgi:hypothetical protein